MPSIPTSEAPPSPADAPHGAPRWPVADVRALFGLPLIELLFRAQQVHRAHFDPSEVQLSTLLSIETGGCAEDCAYCPQSAHYRTGVRLSAGREQMDDALQVLCLAAGANSIFYGERLLTTSNPQLARDRAPFDRIGLRAMER
jgi:biotin synthase-like enzyme